MPTDLKFPMSPRGYSPHPLRRVWAALLLIAAMVFALATVNALQTSWLSDLGEFDDAAPERSQPSYPVP